MENVIASTNRHSREELLKMLKLEERAVAAGVYRATPRRPHPEVFRDSITCLQFGREAFEPCDLCWLMDFVPRDNTPDSLPCHQIPLNQNGDTVASLERTGDRELLEKTLLAWLRETIAKLEQETAAVSGRSVARK